MDHSNNHTTAYIPYVTPYSNVYKIISKTMPKRHSIKNHEIHVSTQKILLKVSRTVEWRVQSTLTAYNVRTSKFRKRAIRENSMYNSTFRHAHVFTCISNASRFEEYDHLLYFQTLETLLSLYWRGKVREGRTWFDERGEYYGKLL